LQPWHIPRRPGLEGRDDHWEEEGTKSTAKLDFEIKEFTKLTSQYLQIISRIKALPSGPSDQAASDLYWRSLAMDNEFEIREEHITSMTDYIPKTSLRLQELLSLLRGTDDPQLISKDVYRRSSVLDEMFQIVNTPEYLFWATIVDFTAGRNFIVTKNGHFGWAAPNIAIGDQLCFFQGGWIPFSIREVKDGEKKGCYTLQSDCYVHGLMSGGATNFPDLKMRKIELV